MSEREEMRLGAPDEQTTVVLVSGEVYPSTDTTRILVQVPRLEADDIVAFGRRIQQYLPSNYRLVSIDQGGAVVLGSDRLGWTAEGYVLPRLASGLIFGKVVSS